MRKIKDNGLPEHVTVTTAAELLNVTPTYIRKLIREGRIPKSGRGTVPLAGAIRGFIDLLRDEERRSSKSAAAAEVQNARADEIRLRIAREQGALVDINSSLSVVAECVGTLRHELAGIPAAATRDLPTRVTIENLIEAAVVRARTKFERQAARLRAGPKKGSPK